MSLADVKKNAQERMVKSLETLRADLAKVRTGRAHTGILDHVFGVYLAEAEPQGVSFIDWVQSPAYDQDRIRASFKAQWWGTMLTEKLLRRE